MAPSFGVGGAGSSTAVVKLITSDYYDLVFGVHRSLVPPEATSPPRNCFSLVTLRCKVVELGFRLKTRVEHDLGGSQRFLLNSNQSITFRFSSPAVSRLLVLILTDCWRSKQNQTRHIPLQGTGIMDDNDTLKSGVISA